MSKQDTLQEGRLQGMYYAYEQIKENGLDDFKNELVWRKKNGITVLNTRKELEKWKNYTVDTAIKVMAAFAMNTLWDEFDFDGDQCEEFLKRLELKSKSLAVGNISWEEQISILEDEMNIHINWGDSHG